MIILSSCLKKTVEKTELTANTPNLRDSMSDFFQTEDQGYVKGDAFQAKFISCDKIIFAPENYKTSYVFYRYRLVIAPVTNEPVHIKKIHFSVNSEILEDYYRNYRNNGRTGLFDESVQIGEISPDIFEAWEDESQMIANEFDFTVDNMGDDLQAQANISSQAFDEGMQELKITIYYNQTSETIILKYTGELAVISDVDEAVKLNRPDITELLTEGRSTSWMFPFEATTK